jgi:carbon-monoxide dehydrogenase large subunit
MLPGPYRIRAYTYETHGVATNKAPAGPYRGVAYPVSTFVMEGLIDRAARALGQDPAEIRLKNLIRREEFPYTTVTGMIYDPGSYVESLERLLVSLDYPALRRTQAELRAQGRHLGVGFSSYCETTGIGSRGYERRGILQASGYDVATVRIDPSGKVTAAVGVSSHGQGLETSLAQLVADELGVPFRDVTVVQSDTAVVPYGMGTFASRSAVIGGGATIKAARKVREKVLQIAAHRLEASPEDLIIEDGRVFVRGVPASALSVGVIARLAYFLPNALPTGTEPGLEATQYYDPPSISFSNATHAAVVEVDPETGASRLLRYLVVEDCGTVINPLIVDGQVHGGVAQGVGGALWEELVYDPAGQPLADTLLEYAIPTAADLPSVVVEHLETPSPWTINGIKGMGEGGTIGATAAVANAVADALAPLGATVNTLPLRPHRVFEAIHARRDSSAP